MNRHKISLILILAVCFLAIPLNLYANDKEETIYKNVYIQNIDISGLTKEQAIDKINKSIYTKPNIYFEYQGSKYEFNLKDIDLKYNVEESVLKALKITRNENFIDNTKTKVNLNLGKKINFNLIPKFNKEKLYNNIYKLSNEIYTPAINASIEIIDEQIKINDEKNGTKLNKEIINQIIVKKIKNIDFKEENLPVNIIKAKHTKEKLSKINSVLGKYETTFNKSNYNRTNNIFIVANKTNNIILDKEEEFSFNNSTGKRNEKEGFKEAPIIINGELKKGVGGGICQVSTTMYNAALYSGLEITQSRNHSIPSAYIQKGRDATVSYGSVDLKFKNIYEDPILIQNKIENNKIISTIYGNEKYKQTIDVVTDVIDVIPNSVIVKNNNKMYAGEKYIKEKGRKGYKVKTYRVYKNEDGSILKRELINESYYPPMNKIIIKGTKPKNEGFMI